MYRVVIVDDEPIIVEGLSKSVDWGSKNCKVVGTAYSAEEGLSVIRNKKPDIIFSDIRMSHMDGLSMIAAIKSEFPGTQVAILTGFRDFDYAQRAIKLGVTRFLLKPSKMNEIDEALSVMVERLNEEAISADREKMVTRIITKNSDGNEAELLAAETFGEKKKAEEIKENLQAEEAPVGFAGEKSAALEEDEENAALDSAASSFIVKNAVSYIEEHYKEKLKLSDVAEQVYVSQWHLSKLLNRHLEQNFSEILNGIRIAKAKELLKDPSLRIGDIADEVGFLDMAHFSRVFKKQVGISANEYRNNI